MKSSSLDVNPLLPTPIMGALDAHISMSKQALNSDDVRTGMKDILVNKAGLYGTLREQVAD